MKTSKADRAVMAIIYTVLILLCLITILPFMQVLTISISPASVINKYGQHIIPTAIDLSGYKKVFNTPLIWRSYGNTIIRTALGTGISMVLLVLGAYPLSKKYLPNRKLWTGLIIFTMYFQGGLVPLYIQVKALHLLNTIWALVLPPAVSAFNLIILRNFFNALPDEIEESAEMDGASSLQILCKIVLPLSKPVLATVSLWCMVYHWNEWFNCMIYMSDDRKFVLQYVLRQVLFQGMDMAAEFEAAMYKFAKEDPDGNGVDDTYGLSNTVMATVLGAYGPMAIKDFKGNPLPVLRWQKDGEDVKLCALTDETRQGLETLQRWYNDGIIDPEFITGENTGGYWAISQAFINGRVGVTGNVMYDHWTPPLAENDLGGNVYQEFKKVNPELEYGKDFILGKAPVGPEGASGTDLWGYVAETMVLSSKCVEDRRKVDIIMQMLDDFVADEEYSMLIRQGIEGEDYEQEEDGNVVQKVTDPAGRVSKGIQVFTFLSSIPEYEKKFSPKLYAFADETKGTGYMVPPVPSTDATTQYMTTLQTLTIEYFTKIVTGEYSIDQFDEYIQKMKENGSDEVERQANEEWKKLQ